MNLNPYITNSNNNLDSSSFFYTILTYKGDKDYLVIYNNLTRVLSPVILLLLLLYKVTLRKNLSNNSFNEQISLLDLDSKVELKYK